MDTVYISDKTRYLLDKKQLENRSEISKIYFGQNPTLNKTKKQLGNISKVFYIHHMS